MAHRIDYPHFDESAATRALWAAGVGLALLVLVLAITAGSTRVASLDHSTASHSPFTLPMVP